MYGDNFSSVPIKNELTTFIDIGAYTKYYFGKGYTSDASSRTFELTDADYLGTFTEWNTANKLAEGYKYTCMQTTADEKCELLTEISIFNSATSIAAYYYSYGSTSYEATKEDNASSDIKIEIEGWYKDTLSKKIENGENSIKYISNNATFCNDRSISLLDGNGNGFSLSPSTVYGADYRLEYEQTASLLCPDVEHDLFSAKESSGKGNKKLEYPIALITADEIIYAGAFFNIKDNSYLTSDGSYWTMSPSHYTSWAHNARAWIMTADYFSPFAGVYYPVGARAVINLKSDVLVKNGNGTIDDPYTVKLAS